MKLDTHGGKKYPNSKVLISSAERDWDAIAAEVRAHASGEAPGVAAQQTEISIVLGGSDDGLVTCKVGGRYQAGTPRSGAIWLSPLGLEADEIRIAASLPKVLHLYIPNQQFASLAEDYNLSGPPSALRSATAVDDEMVRQIGLSILSELTCETAAGRMLVETASLLLAARLVHSYPDSGSLQLRAPLPGQLGKARLRRVMNYIQDRLTEEITVADLAGAACLSTYHFTRMFSATVGMPPYRYVSQKRLEKAAALVAAGNNSIAEIAFMSRFSSQASFTRAFRRATGFSPGDYRRKMR